MAMTVESIRNVPDDRTYRLLTEPTFQVVGKLFELLDDVEIRLQTVPNTSGLGTDDFIQEDKPIGRNISKLVDIIARGATFELERTSDARLIYTCIDQFMMAQSRIISARKMTIPDEMLEDFRDLTILANYILGYVTTADRIDLMNIPTVQVEEEAVNPFGQFQFMPQINTMSDNPDVELTAPDTSYQASDGNYQSPFTALINRIGENKTRRYL